MPTSSIAIKKTKQELLEEYQKLQEHYDELKMASKITYNPENLEIVSAAKNKTTGDASQAISNFKKSLNEELDNLSIKLNDVLKNLLNQILDETNKFNELQQAIELSKKNLEVTYNIQIVAETLDSLVSEYEKKKNDLETSAKKEQDELENSITSKKRDWEREKEEYEYASRVQKKREASLYKEEREKEERDLIERENALKGREEEFKNLAQQVELMPERLNNELSAKEIEVEKRLNAKWENCLILLKKDYETEKRVYELKIENLDNIAKRQESDIANLRKETEIANKKAQDLALKVIESNAENHSEKINQKETA